MAAFSVDTLRVLSDELVEAKRVAPDDDRADRVKSALEHADAAEVALDAASADPAARAQLSLLRGTVLGTSSDKEEADLAEEHLSSAVKLDPSCIEAWNALGHHYWVRGRPSEAKEVFESALSMKRNVVSLRHLSQLLRQSPTKSAAAKLKSLEVSLKHAKDALGLDFKDSESWYVLGNALVTTFFALGTAADDLDRALQAYNRAEQLAPRPNADLHYNRAELLAYKHQFNGAVDDYVRAAVLDPRDIGSKATDQVRTIVRSVARTGDLVARRGKFKPKKVAELTASIAKCEEALVPPEGYVTKTFAELAVGANRNVCVVVALLMPLNTPAPPDCHLVIDQNSACACLSCYGFDTRHFMSGNGKLVRILNPRVGEVALGGAAVADAVDAATAAILAEAKPYQSVQADKLLDEDVHEWRKGAWAGLHASKGQNDELTRA